jgi:hypothetical protein
MRENSIANTHMTDVAYAVRDAVTHPSDDSGKPPIDIE